MSGTDASGTGESNDTSKSEQTDTTSGEKTEVDWKAKAREWEKRAKENSSAAARLAELEESQKSEAQKLADAKTAAEQAAAEAKADALRWRIAAKHGITDDDAELFLTGSDEGTLTKQAERLTERISDRKKTGNVVPKEGTTTTTGKDDPLREVARGLFGRTD